MTIEAGRVLNERYRLIRPVGQGSQASVWVAEHLALSTQVAVKLIDRDLAKKEDARERFRREATAAAQLRSAHVVQILDHGIDGDQPFIVMELLDGEDLFERLQRRVRLSLQETSKVLTQVARALTRAHGAGIVHRDLKPENVFLIPNDDDEIVKVLDFGVAKVSDPAKRVMQRTGVGTLLGTPHYMSPEQVKGITEVDYRSDIWSVGIIAYQCVTGEMPFDSEGVGDLLIKITLGEMPVPSKVVASVPDEFDAWFAKSCDRDPTKRFETAREQAEALARAGGILLDDDSSGRIRFDKLAPPKPKKASVPAVVGKAVVAPPAKAERDDRESAAPLPLVRASGKKDASESETTDIDAVAPVMEAPRPQLDSTDIEIDEATGTPLPHGQVAAMHQAAILEAEEAEAVRAVSHGVPRSTVSGLARTGPPTYSGPPPELDGSRRKRVVGLVTFGCLALLVFVAWRMAQPHLSASGSVGAAPEEAPTAPTPSTEPTGPAVTSIDPGPNNLEPKKDGPAARPSASTAPSAPTRPGRRGTRPGPPNPKDPVIEYDVPPDEPHGAEPK